MTELVKLVVFVPEADADQVRRALGEAGAGRIGNYSFCSFSSKGTGRFKPEPGADPVIGTVGQLEAVTEERIEVACQRDQLQSIIQAIKKVHPYEEVVIDIYPMLVLDD
ncbi:MAG TPA: YqfO family protein [Candidatus Saccharimonadales bacterium]|nr:YqfO family protein [Candidatus Saccharimonadales bacterium]